MRIALGVAYRGTAYHGWQSQPDGNTVQDRLEAALAALRGRTDPRRLRRAHRCRRPCLATGRAPRHRGRRAWPTRGCAAPIATCPTTSRCNGRCRSRRRSMPGAAHMGRRYAYRLLESPVRPSLEAGQVGWTFRPLDLAAMQQAAAVLIGEHDFSAFRSAECQAATPVRTLRSIAIARRGAYWRFEFDANAFLHHMVRNIMGCLVMIGSGRRTPAWLADVLASRDRSRAAPTDRAGRPLLRRPVLRSGPCHPRPRPQRRLAALTGASATRIKICGLTRESRCRCRGRCRRRCDRLRLLCPRARAT